MKNARLKIRKDESHDAWRLSIPASLSPDGKRKNLYFETKGEAQTKAEEFRAKSDNYGVLGASLTPARIAEAGEAFKMLDGVGVSLIDAVRSYLEDHKQRAASVTLEELFNQYITVKARNHKRAEALKQTSTLFADRASLMACDLTSDRIEAALTGKSAGSRNGHIQKLKAVLNYGVRKGWMVASPIKAVDTARVEKDEVEIVQADVVAALFADAFANDLEMVPFLALTFFQGIRPGGEMNSLDWEQINGSKILRSTKTGMKREIPLNDTTNAFLAAYVARGGVRSGKVVKFTARQLELRRRKNWKAAGYSAIPQDVARHCCSTFHLAMYGDISKTRMLMGHNSGERIFWDHYAGHATLEQSQAFWALRPVDQAGNVVPFVAAA